MLPAALATGQRVVMTLRGGTDVRAAPPIDYVRLVLLPLLVRMGVQAELKIVRRGYYPKGGGEVRLGVQPNARLLPFVVADRGPIERIEAHVHVAHLPRHIAERMMFAARAALPPSAPLETGVEVCAPELAFGPGVAIVLLALAAHTALGAAGRDPSDACRSF